ncbi:MAG: DUF6623 family protein [Nitrospirales bacterium]|nr:S8 family serine peptidase [Nitrospirales bacterium]
MERAYYKRDQRIVVEEIPNVRAMHLSVNERGAPRISEERFGISAIETVRSNVGVEFPEEALAAFEQANWRFIQPSTEMTRSLAAGESLGGAEEIGKVIRRADGSVAVATNKMNVQLRSEFSEEECGTILAEKRLNVLAKLKFAPNLYEVIAQGREDALEASVELHEDSRFTLAEPSLTEYISQRFTPTDPRYIDQWQWKNIGQSSGAVGADVSAEEAWDITRGAGIRVAIIDNGFDADHEDLSPGVSVMSGYFSPSGGGATTFTQGIVGMPDNNHGTFCAGMVGARHNNARGGCGGAPECELMLIATLGDQVGTQTTLARAVAYAADPTNEISTASAADGADILVSSLGPNGAVWNLTATLELALEAAAANGRNGRGLSTFWAASNGHNVDVTQDEVVSHEDVIAVVRSNRNDLEDNAARGETVELIAPGVNVFSTTSGNGYGASTGTSFAAPCVAGCAALALSMNLNLTRDELRQILRDTADKIGGVVYDANGHNDDYGYGRVNAHQAVLRAANSISSTLAQAMWSHGHSMQIEYPDRIQAVWRTGFYIRVEGNSNTSNWFHFAIPTPVIVNDNRLSLGSVMIRFRSASDKAFVHAVHIYDGETKVAFHDGLRLAPQGGFDWPRFDVPTHPKVKWGLGISLGVTFEGTNETENRMEFSSAGCDFQF